VSRSRRARLRGLSPEARLLYEVSRLYCIEMNTAGIIPEALPHWFVEESMIETDPKKLTARVVKRAREEAARNKQLMVSERVN
jgi:hypothetical protein